MNQILSTAGNPINKVLAVAFRYHGKSRIVDNIDFDVKNGLIIGFEMRESGRFSYKIKKFKLDKIESDLRMITPPLRKGPKIGRPVAS